MQWNAILDSHMHPERVCPWWIKASDCAKQKHITILPPPKKARVLDLPLPGLGGFAKDGQFLSIHFSNLSYLRHSLEFKEATKCYNFSCL